MNYEKIVRHYENCFAEHGNSHLGVDWPNKADADKRYQVMLDVVREDSATKILDFGCGLAHLYKYMNDHDCKHEYAGWDLSQKFIDECKKQYPSVNFYCGDILNNHTPPVELRLYSNERCIYRAERIEFWRDGKIFSQYVENDFSPCRQRHSI